MKKKLIMFAITLSAFLAGIKIWLNIEVQKVQWAIELVGGMNALLSTRSEPLTEHEKLFLRTTRVTRDDEIIHEIEKLKLCAEDSDECSTRLFTFINAALVGQKDVSSIELLLTQYKQTTPLKTTECEAKYEISRAILASRHALSLSDKAAKGSARDAIEKIKINGGIDYSLNTESCKAYFARKPTIAKAYLAHIAFLMSIEKGNISPGWVYLTAVPGVKSLLDEGIIK